MLFEGGGLRETKLGHLYIQVSECEGVVVVVLVVFISAVIKRLLWLRRCRCCSLCRRRGRKKRVTMVRIQIFLLLIHQNRNSTRLTKCNTLSNPVSFSQFMIFKPQKLCSRFNHRINPNIKTKMWLCKYFKRFFEGAAHLNIHTC